MTEHQESCDNRATIAVTLQQLTMSQSLGIFVKALLYAMPYQLEPLPPSPPSPPNLHQYNSGRATATGREDSFQLRVHLAQTWHSYLRSQHRFGILQIPNWWRVDCRCSVSAQLTTVERPSIGSLHSDVKDRHFIM